MTYQIPITQADLQAYVDAQLSPTRQREVKEYLEENPEAAAMVEDYRNISDSIHEYFDPILKEPIPAQLNVTLLPRRLKILRVVAAVGWIALGTLFGSQLPLAFVEMTSGDTMTADLVAPAAFAHTVYSPEIRHPVEVRGDEQQHLVKWLSKRLRTELSVPDLSTHGFELVGGRLLPSTNRMAAQFMYQRGDGVRVTLYNRHGVWDNAQTSFHYSNQGDTSVFYWIDGPLGFALVGNLSKNELLLLAEDIYKQQNG